MTNVRQHASNRGKDSSKADNGVQGCTKTSPRQFNTRVDLMKKITNQQPSGEALWQ